MEKKKSGAFKSFNEVKKDAIRKEFEEFKAEIVTQTTNQLRGMMIKQIALENMIQDKLSISETELEVAISKVEDTFFFMEDVQETKEGDRLKLKVDYVDEDKLVKSTFIAIDSLKKLQSPLPPTVEDKLVGAKVGATFKDVLEAKDGDMKINLELVKISRHRPATPPMPQEPTQPQE